MSRSVPAVTRALDILELFVGEPRLSIPEVRDRLDLPRTSVHELVHTLVDRAYLTPVPGHEHRYQLGVSAFHLGAAYADQTDLAREGQAAAEQVSGSCGETVHVAVLDGTEVVYIAKVDSTQPVRMVSAVGHRLPAHCTAVGKPMLADLPTDELDRRYPVDRELAAMTTKSITDPRRLRDELAQVRRDGLAHDDCESNDAVCCVAAPVHDRSGAVVAGLSVSAPILRWDDRRRDELAALVLDGAARLSRRLGWSG